MSMRTTVWVLSSSLLLCAGCISLPPSAPTSTLSPSGTPTTQAWLTPTSSPTEPRSTPEPGPTIVFLPTPNPSATPTASLPWEPAGIFFEEGGSIYHTDFDGSSKQLIVPGERLISVSPDGRWVISEGHSGVHLVSSIGERADLPPAESNIWFWSDAYFWSPDSSAVILLRNLGSPQQESVYERWSIPPIDLGSRFQVDGELLPIGIGSQSNLLLETLNASDYDPGPLDYTPGYYAYDDRHQQLLQIGSIDPSIEPVAIGGRRHATLSPQGDKMAVSLDGINIWVFDLQSGRVIRKTSFTTDPNVGGVGRILWSPQETRLAFEQTGVYHRETAKLENRVAFLDLESGEIAIVSDETVFALANLPSDFPLQQSFFQPAGWDESGEGLFVYFEVIAIEGAYGHRDYRDYPRLRRIHSFWWLELDTLALETIPWLGNTHAVFPRYSSAE